MNTFAHQTLKTYDLRHTGCREAILMAFYEQPTALSHGHLEELLPNLYDRVTIYRTLKTFVEKGIVHKVLDEDGIRYALCKTACSHQHHHHDHVHFKCVACGQTTCLETIVIPQIALPNGYKSQEINLLVQGTCLSCNVTIDSNTY
ncbi:MAG: transcriptional repressor [Cytophagia bacterium]|nr:MAG: transcriptional repressor [Runella sp.]TAG19353.1 MAG: transcriptional repressor [Cytophagales bacterium]TAG38617.1 MAG: transcriptional repressor [Cytophagia bacterium]TAG74715.1 MAG: transcriptional repressor [Runella slithyformis]TAG80267.1 MAG: transcriptional repressor [Cytophagales bacterium]